MTGGVIGIVLILVGLPLLAVWVGGRGFWSRLRPGRGADPYGDLVRRHALGTAALVRVEQAVRAGSELRDPRERAAVVDFAHASLAPFQRRPRHGPLWRVLRALVPVYLVAWVWYLVVLVVDGRWGELPWGTLLVLVVAGLYGRRLQQAARRAVQLNSGPPADDAQRE